MNFGAQLSVVVGCAALWSCTPAQRFYQPQTAVPRKPWSGTSGKWGGYSERQLNNGRVEILFTGYNEPSLSSCAFFCKVRAAERSMLDGYVYFYGAEPSVTQTIQESNFPAKVIPGRYEDVPTVEWVKGPNGEAEPINVFRPVWVPPQTIPAHTEINTVNQAKMTINYRGSGKKYDASAILKSAAGGSQKMGKVHLEPAVEAKLDF
ncbi:hypothetical protein ACFPK9_03840 [Rubritalea spongiae]|uniref:Uncharacterized protein n=1 Tax=Rubritalea spongiae TaxID=430797 RepID=A0ABW5E467_9BACT